MTLRDLARLVERAALEDTPLRIHEGPDTLDREGVPAITSTFWQYLEAPRAIDDHAHRYEGEGAACERCSILREFHVNPALLSEFRTPFRAALDDMRQLGDMTSVKRASIVERIGLGMGPVSAAIAEGVPGWCAKTVALDALRIFAERMTDLRLRVE